MAIAIHGVGLLAIVGVALLASWVMVNGNFWDGVVIVLGGAVLLGILLMSAIQLSMLYLTYHETGAIVPGSAVAHD